jgi:hypothetical protein
MATRELRHNEAASRYEMDLDGALAVLDYRKAGGVLTLTHTGVPPEFEGRGHGARLVKAALDDIRARGLKIVPRCWFVAQYIDRHPEYREILA